MKITYGVGFGDVDAVVGDDVGDASTKDSSVGALKAAFPTPRRLDSNYRLHPAAAAVPRAAAGMDDAAGDAAVDDAFRRRKTASRSGVSAAVDDHHPRRQIRFSGKKSF